MYHGEAAFATAIAGPSLIRQDAPSRATPARSVLARARGDLAAYREFEGAATTVAVDVRLVTWKGDAPAGDYDSRPLLAALRDLGVQADIRAWDDPGTDWAEAAVTVIRSTWDYHQDHAGFLDWVDRTAAVTCLQNPPDLVRWNTDKRYLLDLERAGVPIVPTALVDAREPESALREIVARGWDDIVLKPCVSLDGHGVRRVRTGSPEITAALESLGGTATALVAQPYMDFIVDRGELSLAFIGGAYSHTARKRPGPGEFRVQERLGGSVETASPPPGAVKLARDVLDTLDEPPLYARVDLIEASLPGHPPLLLTELELVEPSLFLATHPPAAAAFAAAIARLLPGTASR